MVVVYSGWLCACVCVRDMREFCVICVSFVRRVLSEKDLRSIMLGRFFKNDPKSLRPLVSDIIYNEIINIFLFFISVSNKSRMIRFYIFLEFKI